MRTWAGRYDFGTGWSEAIATGMDSDRTLVIACCDPDATGSERALRDLRRALPTSTIVGCSTAGVSLGATVFDHGVGVAVTRFDRCWTQQVSRPIAGPDQSHAVGAALAMDLAGPHLRCVVLFSEGLHVNGTRLVEGLSANLSPNVVVAGGLAGDGARFQATWVVEQGRIARGRVVAVGLYGADLVIGHGVGGGWSAFGPKRTISRSADNVLYELDGRPALDLYKRYLGDLAASLPSSALLFPVAIQRDPGASTGIIRTVLAVDESSGSMTFAGDMPQGATAQLMRTTLDSLVRAAEHANEIAVAPHPTAGPMLVLSVSCVGRRLVLGQRIDEEAEVIAQRLGDRGVHVGFHSYGEICPAGPRQRSALHNQTMTLLTVCEHEAR